MKNVALLILLFLSSFIHASTYTVTSINDNGTNTLRDVISKSAEGDTVLFSNTLIANGSDTIYLNTEISISKSIFIKGLQNGVDTLWISGRKKNRVFNIDLSSSTNKEMIVSGLYILDGVAKDGGGIYIEGGTKFILKKSIFKDCKSGNGDGGGLYSKIVPIIIDGCLFQNNSAEYGGGVYAHNILQVVNSKFIDNYASNSGGGICISIGAFANLFTLSSLSNCTFINNGCFYSGGGVYISSETYGGQDTTYSKLIVESSTFYKNTNDGIRVQAIAAGSSLHGDCIAELDLRNSTIYKNEGVVVLKGGGVSLHASAYNAKTSEILKTKGSVISENKPNINQSASLISGGYNAFSDASRTGSVSTDVFNAVDSVIKLDTLSFIRGCNTVLMPLSGSNLINSGDTSDKSNAQNGAIVGVRDRGAGEYKTCYLNRSFNVTSCSEYTAPSGAVFTQAGQYFDTLSICGSCDTIFTINLSMLLIDSTLVIEQDTFEICEGENLEFVVETRDTASIGMISDSLVLSWDTLSFSGSFTLIDSSNTPKAKFQWTPKIGDALDSVHKVQLVVKDQFCTEDSLIKNIYIRVKAKPMAKITTDFHCLESYYFVENIDTSTTWVKNKTLVYYNSTLFDSTENLVDTLRTDAFGDYTYSLEILSSLGCTNTVTSLSSYVSTFNSAPVLVADSFNYSICEGELLSISITANDTNTLHADTSYLKMVNSQVSNGVFKVLNSTQRDKNGLFTWQSQKGDARDSVYRFSILSYDNYCEGADSVIKHFTIKVNFNTPPILVVDSLNYSICEGDSISIAVLAKDTNTSHSDTSFLELRNNQIANGKFQLLNPISRDKNGLYTWQTKKGDGRDSVYRFTLITYDDFCNKSDTNFYNFTIKVNALPQINKIDIEGICDSLVANYSVDVDNSTPKPVTYFWEIKDDQNQVIQNTSSNTGRVDFPSIGKYYSELRIQDGKGCVSSFVDSIDIKTSYKLSLGKDTSILDRDKLTLNAGSNFVSYLWSDNSTANTLLVDGSKLDTISHDFWVEVTDSNGCVQADTIKVTIKSTLSISDISVKQLLVYPSPAKGVVSVQLPNALAGGELQVYNSVGEKMETVNEISRTKNQAQLDVSHLPIGIYILKIEYGAKAYWGKFVKE